MSEEVSNELIDDLVGEETETEADASEVVKDEIQEQTGEGAISDDDSNSEGIDKDLGAGSGEEQAAQPANQQVPAGLFAEARRENRQLKQQLDNLNEQVKQFSGLQEQLAELRQQTTQVPMPDPEQDPAGHMIWRLNQLQEENKSIKEQLEQTSTETKQQQEQAQQAKAQQEQVNTLLGHIQTYEKTVVNEHKDYYEALAHMRGQEIDRLVLNGYTPQEAQAISGQQEFNAAVQLMAQGKDPAKIMYETAVNKYGYKSKSKEDFDSKLDSIEKGKAAAKQLGSAGSKASLDDIMDMSDDDFEEFAAAQKEIFG